MRDVWFVDCVPCGSSSHFDTQAEAIAAAEDHNSTAHRGLPEGQRGRGFLACVQQRTIADEPSAPKPAPLPPGEYTVLVEKEQ